MNYSVIISGKTVDVSMTPTAIRVLSEHNISVQVEMELYFSCLIRKRVNFREVAITPVGELITDNLFLQFRPVMTRHCGKDYSGDEPPLTDFPVENAAAFVPKWLTIDYRRGEWQGEFGY